MADLPNDFWSGWIIVLTVTSFFALVWLVISIYFFSNDSAAETEEKEEPVWDETLHEGSFAPPLWWFWLIFVSMIISVIYLIFYPGLGSYKGVLNWSQDSRLQSSYENYHSQFELKRRAIARSSLAELQNSPELMASAERVFSRNCAVCHGYDGRGQASLFPNLMDVDWQWGGSEQEIEQSIRHGRTAVMVGWQSILGDEGLTQVADYVSKLADELPEEHPGQTQYAQFCAACHGVDGSGNTQLGAPRLDDKSWLYGGSIADIQQSISQGRNGLMPGFNERLDDAQIKMLVAWLAR